MRTWTVLLCMGLLAQRGFCVVKFLPQLSPTTHRRTGRFCAPNYPHLRELSPSNIDGIRNELLDITRQRLGHPETSEAMANLIAKAVDTVSELMADGNSTKLLKVTGRTGRLFSETTTSFARLLETVDELLISTDRFGGELLQAKLKLIETTKETLGDFLTDLSEIGVLPLKDADQESEELVHAEEVLIDKTKEAYQIVFDSTESTLRDLLHSNTVSGPVKKLIAVKVVTSAANNLRSFSTLRKRIYGALSSTADKIVSGSGDADMDSFQEHLKKELLATTWKDDIREEDEGEDIPLTSEEQKELLELLQGSDKDVL